MSLTYHEIKDFSAVACTVCSKFNLEEELCFNCKGILECVNCCGCEQLEEGEQMKDYEIKMVYTMYVGLEAENEEEAIEQAKQTAEEQHGNRISEFGVFTVEEGKE